MSRPSHDRARGTSSTHIELDGDDRARLATLHAKLGSQLPELAERFYDRLGGADGARVKLRDAMVGWLEAGCLAERSRTLAAKRAALARHHTSSHLPPLWSTLGLLRSDCDDRIAAAFPATEARLIAKSLDKLFDRELAALSASAMVDCTLASIQTLSTGLAHELRNPVNAARLKLQVIGRRIERDAIGDPRIAADVEAVDHELERLTRLLQEFLAFARPSELALGDRDVTKLIRGVMSSEQPIAAARGVELAPLDAAPCIASVDANKLLQVVQNLVRNALEACDTGGRVTVTLRADDEHVHLTVADTGPGIPEAARQQIFEPFFTTKEQGTGLGLSIVHSFVVQHGGTIEFASTDHGTTFELSLPRGTAAR